MLTTVGVAVLVFSLPGLLVGWLSGLKLPWAAAAAIPFTFGIYGLVAWVLGMAEWRFDVRSVLISTAVIAVVGLAWRLVFAFAGLRVRRRRRREAPEDAEEPNRESRRRRALAGMRSGGILDPRWLLPAAGVIAGAWLIIDRALDMLLSTRHGLDDVFQGWDVHWHASMVRYIDETGIASATLMGGLRNIETQQEMFYPSAWHAGAWLVAELAGLTPIEATNLTGIVLSGLLLPLATALIAWRLIDNRGLTAQLGAGFAGLAVFAAPVLFWVGNYVGAWPYVAAIGAAGVVLALFMSVPAVPVRAFAAALSFIGLFQLHPAPATVVVMALLFWWLLDLLWRPSRRSVGWRAGLKVRSADLGWLAATGVIGVLLVLPQVISGSEQTEDVLSYSAEEDLTRTETWVNSITMNTRHVDFFSDFDIRPILAFAAFGALVALLWRRNLWAPAFYAASVALTANSLRPFDRPWGEWLDLIGGLHYSTAHRLVMPVALFTFAAAGVGLAALIRIICLGPVKNFAAVSGVVSVILSLVVAVPLQSWLQDEMEQGTEDTITAPHDDRMVNDADRAAWDWLATQPRAGEMLIMGDPSDGYGWMYAYNGLHSVSRHFAWPAAGPDSATSMLFWWPQLLGEGEEDDPAAMNDVDRAAEDLNVGYFMISPWPFWGFQEPAFRMIDGLWETRGVTPVYRNEQAVIFAVNQAFTDAELDRMREPGNSPEPLPELITRGEAGVAESAADWAEPYYHRPTPAAATEATAATGG